MGVERRKHPRAKVDLAIKLDDAVSIIETRTQDISSSGLFCQIKRPMPVMTKVAAILLLPVDDKKGVGLTEIECKGVVVRSELKAERDELLYDTAIFFTDLGDSDKEKIDRYIKHRLIEGGD